MGCGIPTTANYIIMVTVAAPTLVLLGVQPLVAHFFVFYYGVLADITPPVALAAYAGCRHGGLGSVQDRQHGVSAWASARRWCRSSSYSRRRCCSSPLGLRGREFALAFGGCVLGITLAIRN